MTLREVSLRGYLSNLVFLFGAAGIAVIVCRMLSHLYGISLFHGMVLAIFLSVLNFIMLNFIKWIPWYFLSLPVLGGFYFRICVLLCALSIVKIFTLFDIDWYAIGFLIGLFVTKAAEIILLMKEKPE